MSSEPVCQVARCWVEVGSFHTLLVVRFMNFIASVWNVLDTPSYGFTPTAALSSAIGIISKHEVFVRLFSTVVNPSSRYVPRNSWDCAFLQSLPDWKIPQIKAQQLDN
jgi:hypothetical protein